ncbi:serine/threonine protein kinase [Flocculibacter collagenilyticus]|uniref:serine/threonine protein kinase n=1 Tax=Flocculibacter collagenilyticus TaxID=2744479 RepID=UPI0018F3E610|nr:serine/threonine protein kinase [Flocculibacter collagenilyticus]
MSQFCFTGLSPDLILDAIESIGIYPDSGLLALNSYENRVYQFHDEALKRYVVKFYRPQRWTKEQIQEEHDFSFELQEDEIPMVAPLKFAGQSLFEYQGYMFAVYPSAGGRIFEVDNLDQLEWMGRFIGRIHTVGQRQAFTARPTITTEEYLSQAADTLKQSGYIPSHLDEAFFTILNHVCKLAAEQYHETNLIRLHGDCHAGNILWTDGGPHFVDLDDARMGPAIQDLWMMLSGDRQTQLLQLDTLISGYEEFCDIDHGQFKLIEPLRAMRMVNYMAWLAKRWQDPAFPRSFTWFNTDKYWEQQILALKEQMSALQEPTLRLLP